MGETGQGGGAEKISVESNEKRQARTEKKGAFRLFERVQSLEYISDIIDRPMEYTMELCREYYCKVHEESKYGKE